MNEIYKNCIDKYEISNYGNVRRLLNNGEYKYLKCSISNRGYKYFQIIRNKKKINNYIHYLVAEYFISKRPDNMVIDHIDRNKLNNNVSNLRYCTHRENIINMDRYRDDIKETDIRLRNNILNSEYYYKKTGGPKYRKRGTGQIYKNEYNTYNTTIIIDKIRYSKNFKTEYEAEQYIQNIKYICNFMKIFEII